MCVYSASKECETVIVIVVAAAVAIVDSKIYCSPPAPVFP